MWIVAVSAALFSLKTGYLILCRGSLPLSCSNVSGDCAPMRRSNNSANVMISNSSPKILPAATKAGTDVFIENSSSSKSALFLSMVFVVYIHAALQRTRKRRVEFFGAVACLVAGVYFFSIHFSTGLNYIAYLMPALLVVFFFSVQLAGAFVINISGIPIAQIRSDISIYAIYELVSKLFALLFVCAIILYMKNKRQEAGSRFNLLISIMPIQSLVLCIIIFGYTSGVAADQSAFIPIVTIIVFPLLVFLSMLALNDKRRTLYYNREYDLAQYGIQIQYKVIIENGLHIDQFDLAAIIANALDNAIEGIVRSEGVDKRILLHISSTSEYISILVENAAAGPVNKHFVTTKPDKVNHGFGITQMKSVAKKYSGDVQPEYDPYAGKFSLNVLLKNQAV